MSLENPTPEELAEFTANVVDEHLAHYAGALVAAAEVGRRHTIHEQAFALAVGAAALRYDLPASAVATEALAVHDGSGVVTERYPHIAGRSDAEWLETAANAWHTVWYESPIKEPADRELTGHLELLEALRKGAAHLGRPRHRRPIAA